MYLFEFFWINIEWNSNVNESIIFGNVGVPNALLRWTFGRECIPAFKLKEGKFQGSTCRHWLAKTVKKWGETFHPLFTNQWRISKEGNSDQWKFAAVGWLTANYYLISIAGK